MPKIGMAGSSVMLLPPLEVLRTALAHEFEAVEILGEFPQCHCEDVEKGVRQEMRAMVRDTGIVLAVHAPFTSLNIAAFNPAIRKESVRQILTAIDLCAEVGGQIVITHNGRYVVPEETRQRMPEAGRAQWERNVASLREIARHADQLGICVCLENIGFEPQGIDQCVDDMLRIRQEVGEPGLAFCMDIGHARINKELAAVIDRMGPHARHVHVADNWGKKDDHLIIGHGDLDYGPCLEFLRHFEHVLTLEVIRVGTDPVPALRSRDHMRALLGL